MHNNNNYINPYDTKDTIFGENLVNITAVDALAPCITRPSVAEVLIMWNGDILIFLQCDSEQPMMFQF